MPHHEPRKVEGRVGDIFFHRFVIETAEGSKILADLGPKGAHAFPLETGTMIVAEGEMKPSELKVVRIGRKGGPLLAIEPRPKHGPHHHHDGADPADAKKAVARVGFEPIGEPRRHPKHFEVLARKGHHFVECHVEFDGHIRKEKPVGPTDAKWSHDLQET